jgi:16S rRNA (cytosine967-C5)-methyltransferase
MKATSLVGHTLELFNLLRRDQSPADRVVDRFFRSRRYLGSKDRRFIAEAVYGMLRHRLLIENIFQHAFREVTGANAARDELASIGAYLSYLLLIELKDEETVSELLGSFWQVYFPRTACRTMVQAILRHRDLEFLPSNPVERLSTKHSFPQWMVEEWLSRFDREETEALCAALNTPAPLTVRVNTLKTTVNECKERLEREGLQVARTKFSPFGLTMSRRTNLNALASFRDGWFDVQDEASQIIPLLLDPQAGDRVIDACAGGGGKTLEIAALMKNEGAIFAFDVDEGRLKSLRKRTERAGVRNVQVVSGSGGDDPSFDQEIEKVDRVLIDAPCSGVGTFRRNPGNKWRVSARFVEQLAHQQRRLLDRWSAFVQPGGRLVYATCTLLREENEAVVEGFLAEHSEFTLSLPSKTLSKFGLASLCENSYVYLYPHRHGTDGFFAAVMRRE